MIRWIGLLVLLSGCANTQGRRGCLANSECPIGSYCVNGNCRTDCRGDFDCAAGLRCDTGLGKCLPIPDGGAADHAPAGDGAMPDLAPEPPDLAAPSDVAMAGDLAAAADGPPPDLTRLPVDYSTPRDLATPLDLARPIADLAMLPDLARPVDLALLPPPDIAMASDLAKPADLSVPRDLAIPPDLVKPPDLVTPPDLAMLRPYGDVCAQNAECKTNICSSNPFANGDRECSGLCQDGCMQGDFCVQAVNQCVQSDIGKTCPSVNGGVACRQGTCLGVQNIPASFYCTRTCTSAADCPAGHTCSLVAQTARVCVNVDTTLVCPATACWYDTACDVLNRCIGNCRGNADCPIDHVCNNYGGGQLFCTPPTTGQRGLGSTCANATQCRSGLCIKDNDNNNFCTVKCSVLKSKGQWCPGGWGCNPTNLSGAWSLVCLQAGLGSIGAPCKDNRDCASGLCVTDNNAQTYCTRFCNDAPCTTSVPKCDPLGIVADGVALKVCSK